MFFVVVIGRVRGLEMEFIFDLELFRFFGWELGLGGEFSLVGLRVDFC